MDEKDWFRLKKYPHIGLPLTLKDRAWVDKYVRDEKKIASHGFYPFIHRETLVRKYRRKTEKDGSKSAYRFSDRKPRELYYANHLDANIFSYYAKLLGEKYEKKLIDLGIQDCATAYRRIAINSKATKAIHKSNCDFAAEIFNYILENKSNKLTAITLDVKSFFDNIPHDKLKKSICYILDKVSLDKDYFNIFKNITRFSFVNENQLFNEFKDDIIIQNKVGIRRKKISKQRYLRNQKAIAYCYLNEFEKRILNKKLVIKNQYVDLVSKEIRNKGIPQGSPISAVLANIYMLSFDKAIATYITSVNGLYRRYSDDMVVICKEEYEKDIQKLFNDEIDKLGLEFQTKKTQIFQFDKIGSRFICAQKLDGKLNNNKNFEYLGFEFDGFNTFLKSASLSGYYRKLKRSIHRGKFYAKVDSAKNGIFKSRLYKKFTYKGAERKRVYIQDKSDPSIWLPTTRYNWGNFISYAYLAANKLPNNKIKRQTRRHWNVLNKLIA
ncbi:reverse transcriptase domain-containing protein [Mucilaginibacter lutimaris]|uniref:Reverse transcriptase domain-containing protein n=1 Tax=Mucilaginibacter lutimaris TaxID=931629 RepID=A0ABW2ZFG3_9SPHI